MCGNQKLFCCILSLPAMYWLDIGAAQMSSKAFSPVGSSRRPWDITTSHSSKLQDVFSGQSPRFLSRWKNSTPRIVSEVPTTPAVRRREAVGLGVCLGLVGLLSQERISNAAEACELTVAPSGLAFCDKVLGNGPEAVKGQLIKTEGALRREVGKREGVRQQLQQGEASHVSSWGRRGYQRLGPRDTGRRRDSSDAGRRQAVAEASSGAGVWQPGSWL